MTYYDILSHIITNHILLHFIIHPPIQTVMLVSFQVHRITCARRPHGVSIRRNSGRTADRLANCFAEGFCWIQRGKTHRIHGAAIYGNMDPINIPPMLVYIPAPWILWVIYLLGIHES